MAPTFHSGEALFNLFKQLVAAHPQHANWVSAGKSYEGRDIPLFRIGSPGGGRVMFLATAHGWEDGGGEIEYEFARWLLESGEPRAQQILQRNYVLMVPVLNIDSYIRGAIGKAERQNRDFRTCQWGVDLNRNQRYSWVANSCNNYDYHGTGPASEPETQTADFVFKTYRPQIYLDMHYGGGEWLAPSPRDKSKNATRTSELVSKMLANWNSTGLRPYRGHDGTLNYPAASAGMLYGDAYDYAGTIKQGEKSCSSWIMEIISDCAGDNRYTQRCTPVTKREYKYKCDQSPGPCWWGAYSHTLPLDKMLEYYYPRVVQIFFAMLEYVQVTTFCSWGDPTPAQWEQFHRMGDINEDGVIDSVDFAIFSEDWGKVGPNLRGDLNGDGRVDAWDLALIVWHMNYKICDYFKP